MNSLYEIEYVGKEICIQINVLRKILKQLILQCDINCKNKFIIAKDENYSIKIVRHSRVL